jgi:transposase
MCNETREELRVRLKLFVLEFANQFGVTKTCKEFNVPRSSFYRWKQRYENEGRSGLYRKKPIAHSHPRKTSSEVVVKILELRKDYQIGALWIAYYLERYHRIKVSESTVTRILRAHGLSRLRDSSQTRATHQTVFKKGPGTPCSARREVLVVER